MVKKARMGSDPFQKKDPLGWIGSDQAEKPENEGGLLSPQSNPGKSSNTSQHGMPSNSSKQEFPGPQSTPKNPDTLGKPLRGTTTSKGLHSGWTRATFIVREETFQKLKAVAYWDRKELKRVVDEAFQSYLAGKKVEAIPNEPE